MKPASIEEIKTELQQLPPKKVLELLLRLARFKKDNKELLTYLLFEAGDEAGFVKSIQIEVDEQFAALQEMPSNPYRKALRKIQRVIAKPIQYMGSKSAAVELYLHFAQRLTEIETSKYTEALRQKLLAQQIVKVKKLLPAIDDDLRYDYEQQLEVLSEAQNTDIPKAKSWWRKPPKQ